MSIQNNKPINVKKIIIVLIILVIPIVIVVVVVPHKTIENISLYTDNRFLIWNDGTIMLNRPYGGSSFSIDIEKWEKNGYDVIYNITARDIMVKTELASDEKLQNDYHESSILYAMNHYNMTRNDAKMTYEFTGERNLPYSYYYVDTNGNHCLFYEGGYGENHIALSKCDIKAQHIQETILSKVVELEFNKEYFVEGMNRITELTSNGYQTPTMTEVPSLSWDNKPTSKYIAVLTKPLENSK